MALTEYWATSPPTHVLVAAYLGLKPKRRRKAIAQNDPAEIAELLGALQGK
jgi:hypothetical protein